MIEESGGGFVYKSEPELITAMDRLLQEPDLRQRLGRNAYQTYLQKWTAASHLDSYFELIHSIQAQRGQPVVQKV